MVRKLRTEDIRVSRVGAEVRVSGKTYHIREKFRLSGCRWLADGQCWVFAGDQANEEAVREWVRKAVQEYNDETQARHQSKLRANAEAKQAFHTNHLWGEALEELLYEKTRQYAEFDRTHDSEDDVTGCVLSLRCQTRSHKSSCKPSDPLCGCFAVVGVSTTRTGDAELRRLETELLSARVRTLLLSRAD